MSTTTGSTLAQSLAHAHAHGPAHAHSSTPAHLAAETAVLRTLYARSKAQHRGQVWLPRLAGVLRLAGLLQRQLADSKARQRENAPAKVGELAAENDTQRALDDARTVALVRRFVVALTGAASLSQQVLALHHFMPLHVLLVASYARLLAVTLALGTTLGVKVDEMVAGEEDVEAGAKSAASEQVKRAAEAGTGKGGESFQTQRGDVGERIERPAKKRAVDLGEASVGGPSRASSTSKAGKEMVVDSVDNSRESKATVEPMDLDPPSLSTEPEPRPKKKPRPTDILDSIFAAADSDGVRSAVSSPEPVKGKTKTKKVKKSLGEPNVPTGLSTASKDKAVEPSSSEPKLKPSKTDSKPKPKDKKRKKHDDLDSIFGF